MLFRCSETPRMVSCSGDVRVCVLVFAGEGSRLLARRVRVLHLHPCVCMLCVLFVFTFDCAPYSAPWAYMYFKGTGICALINAIAKSTRVLGDSQWLVIRSLGKVAPCSAPARFAHLCFGDRNCAFMFWRSEKTTPGDPPRLKPRFKPESTSPPF